MFTWVSLGVTEPYTPKVRDNVVNKINPLNPGMPAREIDRDEQSESLKFPTTSHKSNFSAGTPEYNTFEDSFTKEDRKQIFYAKDIMSKKLITVSAFDRINEVEKIMNTQKFRHLPVINPDSLLQGILSERDLLKFTILRLRNPDMQDDKNRVRDIMKQKVLTAFPETPIRDLARIMFEEKIGAIPVIDKESHRLTGIVTRSDILRKVMNYPPLEIFI